VHGVPAAFSYTYPDICSTPATINFAADSINNTTKYRWNFGDNNKSIDSLASNTYTISGKYTVQLITVSLQGCQDTVFQQIQIGKGDADFQVPSIACVGQPVLLTNNSLPLPKTTTWQVDNKTLTGTNAVYTFNTGGSFEIKMDADFGTCKQTVIKKVNVLSSPKAAFSESGTLVSCAYPVTVTFTNNSSNASSYQWLFGDGATAPTQHTTHTYTTAGMFNASLIALNANGCTDTLTKQKLVQLGPPVISGFSNLPISGCIPVTAKPKANIVSPEAIVSYDWDFGDGMLHGYDAEPTHTYTVAGYYRVTLTVKTASGCTGTYSMFQAVAGGAFPPVADFSVPDTNVCGNSPVQFSATATGSVTSWNWDFGDGTKSNVQNPVHQYSAEGNYTITLYVSDKGCPSQKQKANYISVKPPFTKIQPVYYCDDRLKVDFKDQSVQPREWNWEFGDGSSSIKQNETHIYSNPGQYHVRLTTTNNGCSNTNDTVVTVIDSKPKITITPTNGIICRNDSISINLDNTVYISDYLWNLADGSTLFGNSHIRYAYKKSGIFTPYLIVNYVNGCKDTTTVTQGVHVYGPTAGFSIPASACLNNAITFVDTSNTDGMHAIKIWEWKDDDGGTVKQASAPFSHLYTTGGTYIPALKVTDTFGCTDSVAATKPLNVKGATAAFDFTTTSPTCNTALYAFTSQSTQSNDIITEYKWSFGDGDSAYIKEPQHYYTQSIKGAQTSLTIVTAGGCADTTIKAITVNIDGVPKVEMKIPATACLHAPAEFTASQTGNTNATQWLWDFGNGITSNEQNTTYTYDAARTYNVKLIAGTSTTCADTVTQTITVNPLPDVTTEKEVIVCAGKTTILSVTGTETYTWQPVMNLSCTDCAAPVASPVVTTKYYVKGTDNNGCTSTDSVLIKVQQQQPLSVQKNSITVCAGDSIVLAASGSDMYMWQPATGLSNSTTATPVVKPLVSTTYEVTATDKYHCFTSSEQVNVVISNKPAFNIVDTLLTLNKGAKQQLQTNNSADVVNWLWQPKQGLNCYNCAAPVLTVNQPLTYTATATTAAGCSVTDAVRIAILCDNANLYIPTGFTPNGDGKNDRFIPLSVSGTSQRIKSFEIFNNAGQSVFRKQNIYTNSYTDGWDGTYNSYALGGSVFIYRIEVECEGKTIPFTGTVTLIR
jgi:gliding motility-associated-like protein